LLTVSAETSRLHACPVDTNPCLLLRAILQARDLKHRHRGHLMEHMEVVVDVKGPGQVVGEVFMQEAPPPCRYSARARGDVLALKLTQENYVRALASMMYEAEHGARASAHSGSAQTRGRPLPSASASSPGLLGVRPGGGAGSSSSMLPLAQVQAAPSSSGPLPAASRSSGSSGPAAVYTASAFNQQASLSPNSAASAAAVAAAAAAAAAAGGGAFAGRVAVPTAMQSSTCGSLPSSKEAGRQGLSNSTPFDSSSGGSIVARGGSSSLSTQRGVRGTAGSAADDSGPIKQLGSGDATDDEGQQLSQPVSLPAAAAAAAAAAALREG
jgi:hypothetical protein